MPANQSPISSRNASKEAFENEKLAARSMTRAASQMHPVTKAVTEPLRRIGEGVKKYADGGKVDVSKMTDEERYGKVGAAIRRLDPEAYKTRPKTAEGNLALLKELQAKAKGGEKAPPASRTMPPEEFAEYAKPSAPKKSAPKKSAPKKSAPPPPPQSGGGPRRGGARRAPAPSASRTMSPEEFSEYAKPSAPKKYAAGGAVRGDGISRVKTRRRMR